jgi:hypothetical protein
VSEIQAGNNNLSIDTNATIVATADSSITVISSGSNVNISASQSLNLEAINGALTITGSALQSTAFGIPSGQYLRINLNGNFYKIALLNDV